MKTFKKVMALLLVMAMVLSFAACGKGKDSEKKGGEKYGGEIHILRSSGTVALNGLYKGIKPDYVCPAIETLLWTNPVTQESAPWLATKAEMDADGNVTVTLREGVKFHDGSELDAEVVKWNIDKRTENKQVSSLYNPTVEVISKYVCKFVFKEFHLDAVETVGSIGIYSKKAWEDHDDDWYLNNPVGTGAFKFESYVPDQTIVYTKFDGYWGKDADGNQLPYADKYIEDIIVEDNSAVTAMINEDTHTALNGNQVVIDQMAQNGYKDLHTDTFSNIAVYGFAPNSKVEGSPWADVNVRKAVMLYGVDYAAVTSLAGGARAINARNLCKEGSLCYNPEIEKAYEYNVDKAKQMLADAGYPDGFETTIYTISMQAYKDAALVLQKDFEALGIKANVEVIVNSDPRRTDGVTDGVFLSSTYQRYDLFTGAFKSILTQTSSGNGKGIKFSDEYQALLNKGMAARTYEERGKIGVELQYKALVEECTYAALFGIAPAVFVNEKLHDSGADIQKYTPHCTWLSK